MTTETPAPKGYLPVVWQDHSPNLFSMERQERFLGWISQFIAGEPSCQKLIAKLLGEVRDKSKFTHGEIMIVYPDDHQGWRAASLDLGHDRWCRCSQCKEASLTKEGADAGHDRAITR